MKTVRSYKGSFAAIVHQLIGGIRAAMGCTGSTSIHEGDQVMELFAEHLGVNVIRVNAAERFFAALAGVSDAEEKRKIYGGQFIEVFDEEAHKLDAIEWLAHRP